MNRPSVYRSARSRLRAGLATTGLAAATVVATTSVLWAVGPAEAVTGYHVISDVGPINVRSGPGTGFSIVGRLADGQALDIRCQTKGSMIGTGLNGTPTDVWDRLASGGYITDYYTSTPGLAGGWTAGIPNCTAGAPTAAPVVRAPTDSCADVRVLAARGAGEPAGSNALGSVVGPFVTALRAALPRAEVAVWANTTRGSVLGSPVTSRTVSTLRATVATTAAATRKKLDAQLLACPNERLVLVGYGSGAAAAHQVWDAVMAGTGVDRHRGRIPAVVLFADPLFDPTQRTSKAATTLGVGTFDPRRPGLLGPDSLVWSPKMTAMFWMKSYCAKGDVLCNTDLTHTNAGAVTYGSYARTGTATRAGTQAGQWLSAKYFTSVSAATSRST